MASPGAPSSSTPTASLSSLRDRIPKLEPRRRPAPPANPTPAPATPSLPPPTAAAPSDSPHIFLLPRRRILSPHDHELFLASPTCTLLQAWVFGLADAVENTPASVYAEALHAWRCANGTADASAPPPKPSLSSLPQRPLAPVVCSILSILDDAETLLDACPPDETGGSRFGNKRFRAFVDLVRQRAPAWHERLGLTKSETENNGSEMPVDAIVEAATYLGQSFGNRARIDYGSGHELHFVVWLLCLYQLGLVATADLPALVLVVFARYLALMRRIQTTYYLEPAGSHGVWGLDDYQFLPFLFGAAQLLDHRFITPRAVHQPLTLEQFGDDYLYLSQVRFVNSIKVATGSTGPGVPGSDDGAPAAPAAAAAAKNSLRWHSPMLDDISAARSWRKIEGGMRRMFVAEVLRKLPVMQHFLFGSLVPAAPGMTHTDGSNANEAVSDSESDDDADDDGTPVNVFDEGGVRHIHNPSGWGDCCGIRVPSSIGAAGEMRKRGGGGLRRIPFD